MTGFYVLVANSSAKSLTKSLKSINETLTIAFEIG